MVTILLAVGGHINDFRPRRDDADVTVTAVSLGGFGFYASILGSGVPLAARSSTARRKRAAAWTTKGSYRGASMSEAHTNDDYYEWKHSKIDRSAARL